MTRVFGLMIIIVKCDLTRIGKNTIAMPVNGS